jgi:hypothetical protein
VSAAASAEWRARVCTLERYEQFFQKPGQTTLLSVAQRRQELALVGQMLRGNLVDQRRAFARQFNQ